MRELESTGLPAMPNACHKEQSFGLGDAAAAGSGIGERARLTVQNAREHSRNSPITRAMAALRTTQK
jgi:hypothetical protein